MKKTNLVDQTCDHIQKLIQQKEYDENGYLLSEGEMAIKFDVSRATVREAVRTMEVRGFVDRVHGKGVKVSNNSIEPITQSLKDMISKEENILDELLEIRMMIEPKSAALAASRHTPEDIEALEKTVVTMESIKSINKAYLDADLAFHTLIAKTSKNRINSAIVNSYAGLLQRMIEDFSNDGNSLESRHHFHRNVLEAIKNHDTQGAFDAMKKHLSHTTAIKNIATKGKR